MRTMISVDRWYPTWPLVSVLLSLGLMLVLLASALGTLRSPLQLDYQVAPTGQAHIWSVTRVWPSSFAWAAGLRPGTLLHQDSSPPTSGPTIVEVRAGGRDHAVLLASDGGAAVAATGFELVLAVQVFAIGALTLLFSRARSVATVLLVFCLSIAVGLCGVAAFAHGARWGSALFELSWFVLLPLLVLLLSASLPLGGRTLPYVWRYAAPLGGILLVLEIAGFVDVALYALTSDVVGVLFMCSLVCAIALWVWRAWPTRGGERWPEYRLV
ncbi:MAG: hypothetical protein M3Y74_16545, partial [Chloroflexota bacterium]|nr:hypothetical protein [Chloroflexota bacterium]